MNALPLGEIVSLHTWESLAPTRYRCVKCDAAWPALTTLCPVPYRPTGEDVALLETVISALRATRVNPSDENWVAFSDAVDAYLASRGEP